MVPYYSDPFVTIYHADFRVYRETLDVACVVTDPPYEETGFAWDQWPAGWPTWLAAHVPENASLWCWGTLGMFLDHVLEFRDWRLAQDIVWEKANGSSLHADRFRRVHEQAVQFIRRRTKWGDVYKCPVIRSVEETRKRGPIARQGKPAHWADITREGVTYEYDGTRLARSVMQAGAVREGVDHGTPKPLCILRDLISYSCPPGGTVADIFCGSGSTLVAAKELGRHAIGFDADESSCAEAARRCAQQMPLAPAAPPRKPSRDRVLDHAMALAGAKRCPHCGEWLTSAGGCGGPR